MNFVQHYSSSSGNFYEVTAANGKRLLVECGAKWPKIQKALNYDLSGIVGCLVSHEHADHCVAVRHVLAAGIDVYASGYTFEALGLAMERRTKPVANKTLVRLADFEFLAFNVNHDAAEPLGFVIRDCHSNEFMLFATDTSHLTQRFKLPFSIISLECSYDKEILQNRVDTNDINESLAKRLLTSHMEKQNTIKYLAEFCNLSKCREIHLLHMSGDNIDKEQTRKEVEERFFIKTVIVQGKEAVSHAEI